MSIIVNLPKVTYKIGRGTSKTDREWLNKKKDSIAKLWQKSGSKVLSKIEESCGEGFTNTSRKEGITINLFKRGSQNPAGKIEEENPLSIDLYLLKSDTNSAIKENLVHMLTRSLICQNYQFHFRMRELTLFEDILADELLASVVTYMVLGRKLGRKNCEKALNSAIEETVNRLSQKGPRNKLLDEMCGFTKEYIGKIRKNKTDILTQRESLVSKLLCLLPETVYYEPK